MNYKKKTKVCILISLVLFLVMGFGATAAGAYTFNVKRGEQSSQNSAQLSETNKSKEIISNPYSIYSQYGITYDEKTDSLFYNYECIRYFEDNSTFYNGDGTITGSLMFHTDKRGDGKIDIYTVRNSQNELTGIRVATDEEFMGKTQDYANTLYDISDYKKYGVSTDIAGNIYFEGSLVRELYDPVTGTFIQKNRGASFPKDSIDIEAVYDNGQISGFRIVSQEEYDMRTQERIEAVQDFWVERQKQRN